MWRSNSRDGVCCCWGTTRRRTSIIIGCLRRGREMKPLSRIAAAWILSYGCRLVFAGLPPRPANPLHSEFCRDSCRRAWRRRAAAQWSPFLEILDLRHFSSGDLRPLLEDETQVWSRLLSWDYSGSAEMILRYVDAKILPGYAAVDRGRVFGYSFFVYEGNKGVIGDLYVTNGTRLAQRPRSRNETADPCDRDACSSRREFIAWRRNCWRTRPTRFRGRFWIRDSSGIRDCS